MPAAGTPAGRVALAVPNCSEGRDRHTILRLRAAVAVPGVRVLDLHADPDHHRAVLTAAGPPEALLEAMVALARAARDEIDLGAHEGIHPRVGALDVLPFVFTDPAGRALAVDLARRAAARIGAELGIPCLLYGDAAARPGLRPRDFRRGGAAWLHEEIRAGRIVPDAGPPRAHPTAGVTLVGARPPLIAWNVWMPGATVDQAREVAARVREGGTAGLPAVRALGLWCPAAGVAQVSANLEDFRRTPPGALVAAVRREAGRLGLRAGPSELVGLVPAAALEGVAPAALGLPRLVPGQVLEAHLPALRRPA